MRILGIAKASLIDYPKKTSTVLFIGGCNFRCGYCHNPQLVIEEGEEISQEDVFAFLKQRKRFLDGVVISGGEPTIHKALPIFIEKINNLGYAVKLDTNGTNPKVLAQLIADRQLDYIAMDLKGSLDQYADICEVPFDTGAIGQSIKIIMNSGVDYEFRTTVCREYMTDDTLRALCGEIRGASKYCLQSFKNPGTILRQDKQYSAYSEAEMRALGTIAEGYVKQVILR